MRPDCSARSSSPSIRLRPLAAASSVCSTPMTAISRIERAGRDARSHQAQADHADGLDRARLDVFEAGNFGGRPLGEEDVPQRRRLLRLAQRQERSRAPPPAPPRTDAPPTAAPAARLRCGAFWPRARASALLAAASMASAVAGGTSHAPVRRRAVPTSDRASAMAAARRSPSSIRSTMPSFSASVSGARSGRSRSDRWRRGCRSVAAGAACRPRRARCRASPRAAPA